MDLDQVLCDVTWGALGCRLEMYWYRNIHLDHGVYTW